MFHHKLLRRLLALICALALCLGLQQMGKRAVFGLHGALPDKLAFMADIFPITPSDAVERRIWASCFCKMKTRWCWITIPQTLALESETWCFPMGRRGR